MSTPYWFVRGANYGRYGEDEYAPPNLFPSLDASEDYWAGVQAGRLSRYHEEENFAY